MTHLGCWAHTRRKFIDTQKVAGGKAHKLSKGKKNQLSKADIAPNYIGYLYDMERKGQPKAVLGKAQGYLHKKWKKLTVHTKDGQLNIDNNPAENATHPFEVGRKSDYLVMFPEEPKPMVSSRMITCARFIPTCFVRRQLRYLSFIVLELSRYNRCRPAE
ncbi:IS66 family transposase [Microbulbifer sp. OS29]|uniref:IS66 family transposase n=1 Tax=Microbulbifer okhotskensis TaxID=2926617 RepID=A0A9X2ET17_9GAMM|nr:IS66 family transposase [Microbulbifer okhotskensis]MCO1336965.1 IS66 family transposase [Microbulbifer okhotskensis]